MFRPRGPGRAPTQGRYVREAQLSAAGPTVDLRDSRVEAFVRA